MEDCYFFLYSECKLKDRCMYRHNLMSKDNLITCKVWKKTKKCRIDCPFRHSEYHELKQRKDTMCYWENKGGCTKHRCEYKHNDPSKDEWKEVKVKSLSEIKSSKNVIEITNENKVEEPDISCSEVVEIDIEKDTPKNVCGERKESQEIKTKEEVQQEEVKRIKKEITHQEFEDLDKELEELDDILNESE